MPLLPREVLIGTVLHGYNNGDIEWMDSPWDALVRVRDLEIAEMLRENVLCMTRRSCPTCKELMRLADEIEEGEE